MGGNIFCKQSVHNILSEINHRIQKKWFRNNSKIPKNNKVLDKAYLNTIQNIFKLCFIDLLLSLFLLKFIFLKEVKELIL